MKYKSRKCCVNTGKTKLTARKTKNTDSSSSMTDVYSHTAENEGTSFNTSTQVETFFESNKSLLYFQDIPENENILQDICAPYHDKSSKKDVGILNESISNEKGQASEFKNLNIGSHKIYCSSKRYSRIQNTTETSDIYKRTRNSLNKSEKQEPIDFPDSVKNSVLSSDLLPTNDSEIIDNFQTHPRRSLNLTLNDSSCDRLKISNNTAFMKSKRNIKAKKLEDPCLIASTSSLFTGSLNGKKGKSRKNIKVKEEESCKISLDYLVSEALRYADQLQPRILLTDIFNDCEMLENNLKHSESLTILSNDNTTVDSSAEPNEMEDLFRQSSVDTNIAPKNTKRNKKQITANTHEHTIENGIFEASENSDENTRDAAKCNKFENDEGNAAVEFDKQNKAPNSSFRGKRKNEIQKSKISSESRNSEVLNHTFNDAASKVSALLEKDPKVENSSEINLLSSKCTKIMSPNLVDGALNEIGSTETSRVLPVGRKNLSLMDMLKRYSEKKNVTTEPSVNKVRTNSISNGLDDSMEYAFKSLEQAKAIGILSQEKEVSSSNKKDSKKSNLPEMQENPLCLNSTSDEISGKEKLQPLQNIKRFSTNDISSNSNIVNLLSSCAETTTTSETKVSHTQNDIDSITENRNSTEKSKNKITDYLMPSRMQTRTLTNSLVSKTQSTVLTLNATLRKRAATESHASVKNENKISVKGKINISDGRRLSFKEKSTIKYKSSTESPFLIQNEDVLHINRKLTNSQAFNGKCVSLNEKSPYKSEAETICSSFENENKLPIKIKLKNSDGQSLSLKKNISIKDTTPSESSSSVEKEDTLSINRRLTNSQTYKSKATTDSKSEIRTPMKGKKPHSAHDSLCTDSKLFDNETRKKRQRKGNPRSPSLDSSITALVKTRRKGRSSSVEMKLPNLHSKRASPRKICEILTKAKDKSSAKKRHSKKSSQAVNKKNDPYHTSEVEENNKSQQEYDNIFDTCTPEQEHKHNTTDFFTGLMNPNVPNDNQLVPFSEALTPRYVFNPANNSFILGNPYIQMPSQMIQNIYPPVNQLVQQQNPYLIQSPKLSSNPYSTSQALVTYPIFQARPVLQPSNTQFNSSNCMFGNGTLVPSTPINYSNVNLPSPAVGKRRVPIGLIQNTTATTHTMTDTQTRHPKQFTGKGFNVVKSIVDYDRKSCTYDACDYALRYFTENDEFSQITVKEFYLRSRLADALRPKILDTSQDFDIPPKVEYVFADSFHENPLREIVKDYVAFHVEALYKHPASKDHFVKKAFRYFPFRDCTYLCESFPKQNIQLNQKDIILFLSCSALLVIFDECKKRNILE